ncbi:MAG: metal ABC transporter permease [Spirochaetia bacterium]|jgi:zinc transport system permease protein|nr:metal ABC transporter permease [Spirochaetia bacterium]
MIADFFSALFDPSIPLIRYAVIAGLVSSIAFGMIGSYVVVKRTTYIAGAVSHAALAGIGLSVFLKELYSIMWLTPLLGGIAASVTAALVISWITLKGSERSDTAIGIVWSVGMAAGLLFIFKTPGYGNPMSYLFGNILLITKNDLLIITALDIAVVLVILLFYRQFLALSFDEEFTRVRGVNTIFYDTLLNILIAVTVVLMVSTVGILMVIAFLTIPPAAAGLFTNRLWKMMALSVLICASVTFIGLYISFALDIPSGPTTIIAAAFLYFILIPIGKLAGAKNSKKD